jgi:hypothetical protein
MTDNKKSNQHIDNMVSPSSEQTSKLERIDRHYFTQQVQQVFNVDRGILYFLIFTSIIFSLISYFLNIEYSYFNVNEIQVLQDKINTGDFGEWLNNNIGYTNLIIGIFIALWIRVFVRNYNIFEIIVMLCYILGIMTLILSLAFVIGKVANNGFIVLGVMLIFFLYPIWAIGQFFGKKKFVSYIKSLVVMILGYTSYFFVFILIGYLLNILQN